MRKKDLGGRQTAIREETENLLVKNKRETVTLHQRNILHLLSQRQQLTIGELASLLGVSSVAATKNVNRLEHKQLVRRVVDEWDRRRALVSLTSAGFNIVNERSE